MKNSISNTFKTLAIFKTMITAGLLSLISMSSTVHAEIPSQAFSGLNHFIPTHARKTMYKFRAESNRTIAETEDLSRADPNNSSFGIVGDCSLNIGNVFTDEKTLGRNISDNETVVFIDGDVINASNCGR